MLFLMFNQKRTVRYIVPNIQETTKLLARYLLLQPSDFSEDLTVFSVILVAAIIKSTAIWKTIKKCIPDKYTGPFKLSSFFFFFLMKERNYLLSCLIKHNPNISYLLVMHTWCYKQKFLHNNKMPLVFITEEGTVCYHIIREMSSCILGQSGPVLSSFTSVRLPITTSNLFLSSC